MLADFAKELEESSASSSTTVEGKGKVESWADETNENDFIQYEQGDYSNLIKGATAY
jgi:hypothetical protein